MTRRFWHILFLIALSGCGHAARKDVRAIVDHERALLGLNRAVLRISSADYYLNRLGSEVLEGARGLDGADKKKPSRTLDIYDRFDVILVHSLAPNAWVYGDDFACITTRLFLDADSEEELIAVLAHEFGHVRQYHAVKREERKHAARAGYILLAALAGAVAGSSGDNTLMTTVLNNPKMFLNSYQKYRKADEYEADNAAVEVYQQLRLATDRFDDFFERAVQSYCDYGGGTHPLTVERIARMQKRLAKDADCENVKARDLARLRALQRTVALHILERARTNTLYGIELEWARLSSTGYAVHPRFACGAFFVDSQVLVEDMMQVLRERATGW